MGCVKPALWGVVLLAFMALIDVDRAVAETPGKDGVMTLSSGNNILNEYAGVTSSASAGAFAITVENLASRLPSLSPGDLIMIYQANGAAISQIDTAAYGAVTSLGNAGRYEFQTVASISGNTINFETYAGNCSGLDYSYNSGRAQVIRVPQYSDFTLNSGATVTAPQWDGTRGGVVALHVQNTATINGTINVNADGFRGGELDNLTSPTSGTKPDGYRSTSPNDGAEKGESIAGYQMDYTAGMYGRGAPANGGGGGNGHNAGGGGGANGNNGVTWTGQGNPDLSDPSWTAAWDIDGLLTSTSVSGGGGRGGYSYGRDGNALTMPPGDPGWTGSDARRNVGGYGGRPVPFDATGRLFFGGGGGAGDANNTAGGAGGRGGGLAFLIAETVTGSGTISANGQSGRNSTPSHNDAPGGGGGGGTIVIKADTLSGVTLRARGGNGGNQLITNNENEGPGGGGGGGVIAIEGGFTSTNASGGNNGTTSSSSMTEFIPNGATQGAQGQDSASAPSDTALPFCRIPNTRLTATKDVSFWDPSGTGVYAVPGEDALYTLTIRNDTITPVDPGTIVLVDKMPPDMSFYNDELDPSSAPVSGPVEFIDSGSTLSCCTAPGQIEYSDTAIGVPVFGYVPEPGHDNNVRYIRITLGGQMAPNSSFQVRFRAKIQ